MSDRKGSSLLASASSQPSPPVARVPLKWWQWLSGGGHGGSDTPPSLGPSLRPLDLEFMKHLSKVVNIIPVIAKADTMTLEEKSEFKQRVRRPPPPFPVSILAFPSSGPSPLLSFIIISTLYPASHPAPTQPLKRLDWWYLGTNREEKLVQLQPSCCPPNLPAKTSEHTNHHEHEKPLLTVRLLEGLINQLPASPYCYFP